MFLRYPHTLKFFLNTYLIARKCQTRFTLFAILLVYDKA